MQYSPQDVVHTHYALWLGILGVVYNCRLSLYPDVAPLLSKHPVLPGGHLPFSKHWKQKKINIICTARMRLNSSRLKHKLVKIMLSKHTVRRSCTWHKKPIGSSAQHSYFLVNALTVMMCFGQVIRVQGMIVFIYGATEEFFRIIPNQFCNPLCKKRDHGWCTTY